MRCEEIMKRDVEFVSENTTIQEAARKMRDHDIGFLPVCSTNHEKQVLGTITDRDLVLRVVAEGIRFTTRVGDVMTREVICCKPDDDMARAEELLAKHQKSRMMVVKDGELIGVLSLSDIAKSASANDAGKTLRQVKQPETAVH